MAIVLNTMTIQTIPKGFVDTVVVGNGPSALILSYILHGNIPYYNAAVPHPDPLVHQKLSKTPCLLDIDVENLTAHFGASRISYSTQALPVNVLLDTLLRPLADTEPGAYQSCVEWRYDEKRRKKHIVVGRTPEAGGQWADNSTTVGWDVPSLSYADMLSLPGYPFERHYQAQHRGEPMRTFYRPSRREVAKYLSTYPKMVGIEGSLYNGVCLDGIFRRDSGFYISSHEISCQNIVLASGTFSQTISPRPLLRPLKALSFCEHTRDFPLLVIGSGFTAADIILSTPPNRKILHIYKWDPENFPSPLRACHASEYPEYASVYRKMKTTSRSLLGSEALSALTCSKSNSRIHAHTGYEGLPNTLIESIDMHEKSATLRMRRGDGQMIEREVSGFAFAIGRRGSFTYLDPNLRQEFLEQDIQADLISGRTLRRRVDTDVQLAPNIFAMGSLLGDSLIRLAYGGCVLAASHIIKRDQKPGSISNALASKMISEGQDAWAREHHSVEVTSSRSSLNISADVIANEEPPKVAHTDVSPYNCREETGQTPLTSFNDIS